MFTIYFESSDIIPMPIVCATKYFDYFSFCMGKIVIEQGLSIPEAKTLATYIQSHFQEYESYMNIRQQKTYRNTVYVK